MFTALTSFVANGRLEDTRGTVKEYQDTGIVILEIHFLQGQCHGNLSASSNSSFFKELAAVRKNIVERLEKDRPIGRMALHNNLLFCHCRQEVYDLKEQLKDAEASNVHTHLMGFFWRRSGWSCLVPDDCMRSCSDSIISIKCSSL